MSLRVHSGGHLRPHEGFQSCGDALVALGEGPNRLFVVIDALGHGPDAAKSATRAAEALTALGPAPLRTAFEAADRALAGLREVVMSAVWVTPTEVRFAGVGNVEIIGPAELSRPAPTPGRLGRGLRSLREAALPAAAGQRWVLATDGLRARDLRSAFEAARGLAPDEAAARLIELAGRPNDDASVLVLDFAEAP